VVVEVDRAFETGDYRSVREAVYLGHLVEAELMVYYLQVVVESGFKLVGVDEPGCKLIEEVVAVGAGFDVDA
jgi:hypothetical protein